MVIAIFEVQSAALADGIYNCYKQKLLASGWQAGHGDKFANADEEPVNVEVFNLVENDTVSGYERALAAGDRIAAWQWKDANGNSRWVGIPLVPSVRMARTTEAAGASTSINCNLIANDGVTEITSGLGSGITVYGRITEEGVFNEAQPRLANDDYLFAQNISGQWWFVTVCQRSEDCICSSS